MRPVRRTLLGCAVLWALLPATAIAAPVTVHVADAASVLRPRMAVDPDVALDGAAAEVHVRAAPLAAPERPTLLVLGADDAAPPLPGAGAPGPLRAPAVITWTGPADHPLARVPWSAAPQAAVRPFAAPVGFRVLARAGADALLLEGSVRGVKVLVLAAPPAARANRDLGAWPMLGYTLHAAVLGLAGRTVEPLHRWEAAPLPGPRTRIWFGVIMLALWPLTLLAFVRARRRPEPSDEVLARYTAPARDRAPQWSQPGFARPLCGFFVFLATSLLLLAPYYGLTTVLIPNRVQPFPQAEGYWSSVSEFVLVIFYLFDFGTETSFIRFFAASRLSDPRKAMRYGQLYVWWQVLSGLLQVSAIGIFVLWGPVETSAYGYLAFFFLLSVASQFPGFLSVAFNLLQGAQRFDFVATLEVLENRLLRVIVPIPFVLIFREWGAANPQYGEAFGAVMGLGVGAFVAGWINVGWLSFGLGVFFCRRAGLPVRPLFGASFTRAEIRDLFWYGLRAAPGQFAYRASRSIEVVLVTTFLHNWSEWLGIWGLLFMRFGYIVFLSYRFFDSGMPAFAEALEAKKRALAQYLAARFLQFASLWSATVFAVLGALGPSFIRGALDPQWHRAADFILIAGLAAALGCPGWVSDTFQRGANRPGLFSAVLVGEQALRLGIMLVLVPRLQFAGFYLSVVLSLGLKTLVGWYLNHRLILPLRLSAWQSFGAPLTAGAILFLSLRLAAAAVAPASALAAQLLFYGGFLAAVVAAFFLIALLGGLDAAGLAEIDRAARMSGALRPVAALFAAAARAGARLSPLHGRFVQPAEADAAREAAELAAAAGVARDAQQG